MNKFLYLILFPCLLGMYSCKKVEYSDKDNKDRQQVIDDYYNIKRQNEVYSFSADNEEKLTNCDYGTVNHVVLGKILTQLNYYRRFVGVPELILDTNFNKQCQAFILYARNNKDATSVNPNGKCYSNEAKDAWNTVISSSSYYTNFESPIQYFMMQEGTKAVNRRWLLYPKLSKIGYGQLNTYFGFKVTGIGTESLNQTIPEYVAYPTNGYILNEMLPTTWSIVIPNADVRYSTVTLKMIDFYSKPKLRKKDLPMVDVEISVDNTGWSTHAGANPLGEDPSILFNIKDDRTMDEYYNDEDLKYEVAIKNVLINGVAKDFKYTVNVIRKS